MCLKIHGLDPALFLSTPVLEKRYKKGQKAEKSISGRIICLDRQYFKIYLKMIINGLKKHLNIWRLTKSYNKNCERGYFTEADIKYPEKLYELYNDLSLLFTLRYLHKKLKTRFRSWINFEKSA